MFEDDKTTRIPRSKDGAEETRLIPIICPWCNKLFRIEKWKIKEGRKSGSSHGLCDKCYAKMREDEEEKEQDG